uniref:Syndecan binding protein 2 n=1 Tax=Apteryx owenii TaxID=8824 RepID=A0A8B9S493_APTOW
MATLYPSLEDMKGHQILEVSVGAPSPSSSSSPCPAAAPALYPDLAALEDYMGLSLASEDIQKNLVPAGSAALVPAGPALGQLVAPLSGSDAGLRRAAIKPGLREIHLCKDERGKTGLKLKNVDQGIFVQLVKANSPAALVGLRFGDQVLQLDGESCAGWSSGKAHKALKKASPEKIVMVVRDRPFQRTVTMHKDSTGHVGFVVKKGQIVSLAKDGSAARNGLLTHHYVCEVNGQNVIGLKVGAGLWSPLHERCVPPAVLHRTALHRGTGLRPGRCKENRKESKCKELSAHPGRRAASQQRGAASAGERGCSIAARRLLHAHLPETVLFLLPDTSAAAAVASPESRLRGAPLLPRPPGPRGLHSQTEQPGRPAASGEPGPRVGALQSAVGSVEGGGRAVRGSASGAGGAAGGGGGVVR